MPRTTVTFRDIKDRTLTGATFDSTLKFYDETQSYSIGDIVFFGGKLYKAIQTIPSTTEGDLQYAPYNNQDWVEVNTVKRIENQYQSGQSISFQRYSDVQLVQVYKKHNAENNVDITPIPLTSDAFNYYEFFTLVNNYLKLKETVKYYATPENNLYHKFRLYTNDYVNIYQINSTDS